MATDDGIFRVEVAQDAGTVRLTMWWRATADAPERMTGSVLMNPDKADMLARGMLLASDAAKKQMPSFETRAPGTVNGRPLRPGEVAT